MLITDPAPGTDLLSAPFDHAARQRRLWEKLDAAGVDVLFLPASQSDLEYFTGIPRRAPSFGNIGYTNHWISGAFFSPGEEPLFVLTRHFQEFDLPEGVFAYPTRAGTRYRFNAGGTTRRGLRRPRRR